MNGTIYTEANNREVLLAKTAEDLMTVNPVSIRESATICEAISFLTGAGLSAAPVINDAGQPVGVVSKTDLLRHSIDAALEPAAIQSGHDGAALMCDPQEGWHGPFYKRAATVGEIMTPAIVAVPRRATLAQVAARMTARRVHRVFVLDKTGALVGVVSSLDILRALCD
jgi:CBS domain-containing protein